MRVDTLLGVIVTDRDLSLMKVVKIVFPDARNLLCWFHIDKNVKAKCKTMVAQKNAWDYVMEAGGRERESASYGGILIPFLLVRI